MKKGELSDWLRAALFGLFAGGISGLFMHNVGRSTLNSLLLGSWMAIAVALVIFMESRGITVLAPATSRWGYRLTLSVGLLLLSITLTLALALQ